METADFHILLPIDTNANDVVVSSRLNVGAFPSIENSMAYDPVHVRMYVTADSGVMVIDTDTNKVVGSTIAAYGEGPSNIDL